LEKFRRNSIDGRNAKATIKISRKKINMYFGLKILIV